MKRRIDKAPAAQLLSAIATLLEAGEHSVEELCYETGYSPRAVGVRLEHLQLERRAHRVRVKLPGSPGVSYRWRNGPAADEAAPQLAAPSRAEIVVGVPRQYTVREYQAINRRDPLVAALFGPAR